MAYLQPGRFLTPAPGPEPPRVAARLERAHHLECHYSKAKTMCPTLTSIADDLANAHLTGALLPAMAAPDAPETILEAYAIQEATVLASGMSTGGWKIGCTSAASQARLGSDGPIAGRLFAARIFQSGVTLSDVRTDMLILEAEFAFTLTQDLPPRDVTYSRADVEAAVGELFPAIELVQSRFADPRMSIIGMVTDMSCAGSLILGRSAADWRQVDLAEQAVELIGSAGVLASGHGREVLGHPLTAMTWLANFLSDRRIGLRAGEIVTTGTCITPLMVAPGDEVVADFGRLGQVRVRFAPVATSPDTARE